MSPNRVSAGLSPALPTPPNKGVRIRRFPRATAEEAQKVVEDFVHSYDTERLHSAIGYITPQTKLNGQEDEVFRQRDQKLAVARQQRKINRRKAKQKIQRADSCNLGGASVKHYPYLLSAYKISWEISIHAEPRQV